MSERFEYNDGRGLIAGWVSTDSAAPLGPGVYVVGDLLEFNVATEQLVPLGTGDLAAIYNGKERREISSPGGFDNVIMAGEILESGIRIAGAAIIMSEAQRWIFRRAGFYMKRVF